MAQVSERDSNEIPAADGSMRGPTAYDSHRGQEQEDVVDLHGHGQCLRAEICLREGVMWDLIVEEAKRVEGDDDVCIDTTRSSSSVSLQRWQ
jgi:hypothetical protein